MPRAHDYKGIGRQPADRLVHRSSPEPDELLEILHRHEAARLELAVDEHRLDPLVGEVDLVEEAPRARCHFGRGTFGRRYDQPCSIACDHDGRRSSVRWGAQKKFCSIR